MALLPNELLCPSLFVHGIYRQFAAVEFDCSEIIRACDEADQNFTGDSFVGDVWFNLRVIVDDIESRRWRRPFLPADFY